MRHLPTLFLSLALIVLSGCVCENYYCDDDGCYVCDGIGCQEVEPPERPPCRGDFECGAGELCTDLGCVAECMVDADCAEGYICRAGMCVEPTEPDPTPTPGDCEVDGDCADGLVCEEGMCAEPPPCSTDAECSGDFLCEDGTCVAPPMCTVDTDCGDGSICVDGSCRVDDACGGTSCSCGSDMDCADGSSCVAGACIAEEETCQFNFECDGGTCIDRQCIDSCVMDEECAEGQTCEDGLCEDIPPVTGECESNSDCGDGQICRSTVCIDGCSTDAECGDGRICSPDGTCRTDTSPTPQCRNDSDCRFSCIDGICRVPCENVMECARIDIQFSACTTLSTAAEEMYCRTTNEVTSNCESSAECDGADECVDGVCRTL